MLVCLVKELHRLTNEVGSSLEFEKENMPARLFSETSSQPRDPHAVIALFNENAYKVSCVGTTQKGLRCRNPIAGYNHEEAKKHVDRISRRSLTGEDLRETLETVAQLSLCRRWHQNQMREVTERWMRDLRPVRQSRAETDRVSRNFASPGRRLNDLIPDFVTRTSDLSRARSTLEENLRAIQRLQAAQLVDAIERLTTVLEEYEEREGEPLQAVTLSPRARAAISRWIQPPQPTRAPSASSTATASSARVVPARSDTLSTTTSDGQGSWRHRSNLSREGAPSPSVTPRPEPSVVQSRASSTITSRRHTPAPPESISSRSSVNTGTQSPTTLRRPPRTAVVSSRASSSSSRVAATGSSCSVTHVARREVEGECRICFGAMDDEELDTLAWCKGSCGQNIHEECVTTWHQSTRETRGVASRLRCPYWYVYLFEPPGISFLARANLDNSMMPWQESCDHDEQEPVSSS